MLRRVIRFRIVPLTRLTVPAVAGYTNTERFQRNVVASLPLTKFCHRV